MQRFYLADKHDRMRLATDGTIQAAHDCQPWYFTSSDAAYHHPASQEDGLLVHACPAIETLPGARVGANIADAVMADDVYRAVAMAVADEAKAVGASLESAAL